MIGVGWFAVGLLGGCLNALAQAAAVRRLDPSAPRRCLPALLRGAALRRAVSALLLALALRRGLTAGLLAFAGLWLARWAAIVWWQVRRGGQEEGSAWKR